MDKEREKALEILCMGLRVSAKMRHRETERGRSCGWRGLRTSIRSFPNAIYSQISQLCEWLPLFWFGAWRPVTVYARRHGSFSVTSGWKLVLLEIRHVLSHSHTFAWGFFFFWPRISFLPSLTDDLFFFYVPIQRLSLQGRFPGIPP